MARRRGGLGRCCRPGLAPVFLAAVRGAAAGPSASDRAWGRGREFDCGRNWWEAVTAFLGGDWPKEKKEWCCRHHKVGCESKTPKKVVEYDCQEGYEVREQAWSEQKRTWCCDHERLGCKTDAWNAEPYDCRADLSSWWVLWSDAKKAWCCEFEGHGCGGPSTSTTAEPFDCLSGYLHWQTRWSSDRQAWCCQHHGRGCTTSSSSPPSSNHSEDFDCEDGQSQWETLWSLRKQAWCCEGRARCTRSAASERRTETETSTERPTSTALRTTTTASTTTDELYDCRLDGPGWPEKWTGWKKEWCCDRHGVGCATTTTATASGAKPYDCLEGVATWKESWPADKKRWCCAHELRGCTDCDVACLVAGFPASCRNRIEWLEVHTLNQKANGCTRARHVVLEECPACSRCEVEDACPAVANLTRRFDCQAGRDKLEQGWSRAKKEWCCHYFDVGCPPTTTTTTTITTTPEPYDCAGGVSDRTSSWSQDKKAWCCRFKSIGCTSCDTWCVMDGLSATCRDRVGWLLGHAMRNQEDACAHAHGLVLDQCPACVNCGVADACPRQATTTTTSQPFDCQAGLQNWRLGWSDAKQAWCCRHSGLGCGENRTDEHEAPGEAYDCRAGLSAWSNEKTEWCCTHRNLGCSLLPSATATTAAPARLPHKSARETAPDEVASQEEEAARREEEPYDCQHNVLNWAQTWPKEKQDWCCWRYRLGCPPPGPAPSPARQVVSSQWVARDALPGAQGETLEGYSKSMGGLDDMKRWCEERSDCVGFAMQPESLRWYPKKVGTGFDAGTATWSANKWRGQAWRWYYIQGRAQAAAPEVSAKFEYLPPAAPRSRTREAAPFILPAAAVLAALLAVARLGVPAFRREDRSSAAYLALDPLECAPPRQPTE